MIRAKMNLNIFKFVKAMHRILYSFFQTWCVYTVKHCQKYDTVNIKPSHISENVMMHSVTVILSLLKYSTTQKYLNVIFTFWCDNNKEADLVGFTKHYHTRIIIKVLLSIHGIVKLSSIVTAIQHQFTLRQFQLDSHTNVNTTVIILNIQSLHSDTLTQKLISSFDKYRHWHTRSA